MWNLVLYIVAVIVGLVLYCMYENEESEECSRQLQAGSSSEASVKPAVSDFRFSSLFAVLGFSVPGDTSEERFESFTEHFSTFDEVTVVTSSSSCIVLVTPMQICSKETQQLNICTIVWNCESLKWY